MDGAIMNGKTLRVKQTQLEFGTTDRYVDILGCFKYKPNGNVYIIYTDTNTKYNVVYYGNGHIRQGVILCMQCRDKTTEDEFIKEYIFKITEQQELTNFEPYPLGESDSIEIIGSTKLEIKGEILTKLVNKVIPKPEIKEEKKPKQQPKKKKKTFSQVILGIIIALFIIAGIYYLIGMFTTDMIAKSITCQKTYQNEEIKATVVETNKYSFNVTDYLEKVESTFTYQFDKDSYNEFFLRGTHYKYMTDNDEWQKDDNTYLFKVITTKNIDSSYGEPKDYEEAITYYKALSYSCTEEIEK